ncbi:Phenylalanine--tRNA ligase beta subunit [Buchnera aphidicola (Periphyllus testudinaceus)]|uniref:phenylalanine--tRNA ligase subunit beta n=1 Tax=Buchnera aphidicola TaxID=9 RepID=UPI0034640543
MKFSLSCLKYFLNKNIKDSVICNQLTEIGLEVEDYVKKKYNFKNSIIGKVISIKKLNKCYIFKIYINKNVFIKLLSKKINCYKGMKLAIGIKEYKNFNINEVFLKKNIIKELKWKIYKYSDFNIFGNKNYVVEFPYNVKIGIFVKEYFKKNPEDTILINITPNRNDCLGILGIARDLSVLNNINLKNKYHIQKDIKKKSTKKFNILVQENNICSNYFLKIIKNIDLSIKTPFWIREFLRKSHIESINIVQDVVNYVSLELGQSIHIFDFDKINNNFLKIRLSKKNEKFFLKKNFYIKTVKDTIVLLNNEKIISLGGFINSKDFYINKNTKNIFLGSGVFNHSYIDRIKSNYKNYYLSYDSHFRKCEKYLSYFSLKKITKILLKLCGGKISSVNFFSKFHIKNNKKITLSYKKINKILGFKINKFVIIDILKKLKYCVFENLSKIKVFPPFFRSDILCIEDVISDIARFYGYNKIPSIPLKFFFNSNKVNTNLKKIKKINNFLLNKGYSEVINYSFSDFLSQKIFSKKHKLLKIINPISKDLSYMRASLFPGLIKVMLYNKNRQQDSCSIFESGLCFKKKMNKEFDINQFFVFSGIKSGFKQKKNWLYKDRKFNYYDLKYDVEFFLSYFFNYNEILFKKDSILGFDKNLCSKIYYKNTLIGSIGMLDNSVKKFFQFKDDVFAFEIFIKNLLFIEKKINEFFLYPYSSRDISIIISNKISSSEIVYICYQVSLKYIFNVYIFDVYQGKNIPKDKKSLSIRIFFKSNKKSLTNIEIESLLKQCLKTLKNKFQAELRSK